MPNSKPPLPSAVATAPSRSSRNRSCGPTARKAKIVFYVVWITVVLLAATVAASKWHPIIALFAGAAIGAAIGADRRRRSWPPGPCCAPSGGGLPETRSSPAAWSSAGSSSPTTPTLSIRLAAVAVIVGVPAAIQPVRRCITACWCLVTRHRIRTCFSEFIITNRTGSLPLILWARPTPVGERVWIWLRPGLSLDDLQDRLDKIAVACWASRRPGRGRLGIQRRVRPAGHQAPRRADRHHHLPLLDLIKSGTLPPPSGTHAELPTALDLPDVAASEVVATPADPLKRPDGPGARPAITVGPGCQRRQRHHRLDLIQHGRPSTATRPHLPQATRLATAGNLPALTGLGRVPTQSALRGYLAHITRHPPLLKEQRHVHFRTLPESGHRPGRADAVHVSTPSTWASTNSASRSTSGSSTRTCSPPANPAAANPAC